MNPLGVALHFNVFCRLIGFVSLALQENQFFFPSSSRQVDAQHQQLYPESDEIFLNDLHRSKASHGGDDSGLHTHSVVYTHSYLTTV